MDTWIVRYKWKWLFPRFFYEFWQAPAQWFLRNESVPLFAHLALYYHTEKTCLIGVALLSAGLGLGAGSVGLHFLQLTTLSQVQPLRPLSAGAEVLSTCILPSRQPVLSNTEGGSLGVSQVPLPQKGAYETGTEGKD